MDNSICSRTFYVELGVEQRQNIDTHLPEFVSCPVEAQDQDSSHVAVRIVQILRALSM